MAEPMCAPTDSRATPAARTRSIAAGTSSSAMPNFELAAPVARCGWVAASTAGLILRPIRPPRTPAASSAASAPSDSALTSAPALSASARSPSAWPTPLTTIRSEAMPARVASASSTGPTTSAPIPSTARRRSSAGSGLALTAYATSERAGSTSTHARARSAATSRSVTYSGVPHRSAASTRRSRFTPPVAIAALRRCRPRTSRRLHIGRRRRRRSAAC